MEFGDGQWVKDKQICDRTIHGLTFNTQKYGIYDYHAKLQRQAKEEQSKEKTY